MAHMVETMAYAGEVPWHGLGVQVEENLTPQEMLEVAGLNWQVEKQQLFTSEGIEITGKKGLIRSSDNTVLDVVGDDWNPVQNEEAFEFFKEYVEAGDMEMHTAGSLQNGKMVWALAKTKDSFELFKGDQTDNYLLFSNPHKYGSSIDVRMTPVRVVCNNTLTMSLNEAAIDGVKLSHRKVFNAEMVKQHMGIARTKLDDYKNVVSFIGSKRYNSQTITNYFNEVFGKPSESGKVMEFTSRNAESAYNIINTQPGANFAEGTFWQAFNAVTHMTDHLMGRSNEGRMNAVWYGHHRRLKNKALEKAVEYAEAA